MRVWHDLAVRQMADNSFGYSETLLSRHLCLFSSVFVCVWMIQRQDNRVKERETGSLSPFGVKLIHIPFWLSGCN